MSSAIHKIQVSHSIVEDRLLLSVGASEGTSAKVWLTRRFTVGLWGVLMKILEFFPTLRGALDEEAKKTVVAMRHQQAVEETDMARSSEAPPPPTEDSVFLATGVSSRMVGDKAAVVSITTAEGKQVSITLNENLLHALAQALMETVANANWALDLEVGDAEISAPKGVLH